jgi:hypothetical protein
MKIYKVRGREIAVNGIRSTVHFLSGEHGKKEAGDYLFWTAYGEDRFGDWKITGRSRISLPAPDRFTRMERERRLAKDAKDRRLYGKMYQRLTSIGGIRAATYREVGSWISTHESDAKFIRYPVTIRGKIYKKVAPFV